MKTQEPTSTTYDSIGRAYHFKGQEKYYSVTTMLSQTADKTWLNEWRERVGFAEADRQVKLSSSLGTAFHEIMENYLVRNIIPEDKPTQIGHIVWTAWKRTVPHLEKHMTKFLGSEIPLWSEKLKLAGRADGLMKWDGKLSIIDFKLVRDIYPYNDYEDYRLQCTAYAYMVSERFKMTTKQFVVIMVPKNETSPPYLLVDAPNKYFTKLKERIFQFRQLIKENENVSS